MKFSHTLIEEKPEFQSLQLVGSDRDNALKGFWFPLTSARFLPCTKHVKDDILKQINELHLGDAKQEFIRDIFGDDQREETGLIDRINSEDFDNRLESLASKWNAIEEAVTGKNASKFADYFKLRIAEDMKRGMLPSICKAVLR